MKKLKFKLDGHVVLTKAQMQKVSGGVVAACPTGMVYVQGCGWGYTSSCGQAQADYAWGNTAGDDSCQGTVTGYCCASCATGC